MRTLILLSVLLAIGCTQTPTNQTEKETISTIILMRHAEKEIMDNPNPPLTVQGTLRAARVAEIFGAVEFDAIYSSPFLRTHKTAEPLAISKNLTIKSYNPGELYAFAQQIKEKHVGRTIFISGHSNTTPALINELTGSKQFEAMDESEYDWIYILDLASGGNYSVKKLKITL
jgi:2,3-bisphosphoglycerate-dependent phosphoglycerate mutase